MGIELHCTHCNKLIRAPDTHGGKHGKCPYCKGSVYVPMPPSEDEQIGLAPIDDAEERQRKQLDDDARRMASDLAHDDKAPPEDKGSARRGAEQPSISSQPDPELDLDSLVIGFVQAMQGSQLSEAAQIAAELKPHASKVKDLVQGMMVDEMPPAKLGNIPPGLYKGFLRTLLERL